jgi:release factor glutamine methyltransferase
MIHHEIERLLKQKLHGIYPDREIASMAILIAEHITGYERVRLRLENDIKLSPAQLTDVVAMAERLAGNEPVQYVLGATEFYGLKLKVGPGVLIPRGETEELVEWIVKAQGARLKAQGKVEVKDKGQTIRILDIGCGSGAIAIALAKNLPDAEVVASDISETALQVTRENAGLNNVALSTTILNILTPNELVVSSSFDIIVSNPPYIPHAEMTGMDRHVIDFEPMEALFVPDDEPFLFYSAIAKFAASQLKPFGQVYVEIHDRFGEETSAIFRKWFSHVELRKDIHGKDRMIRAYHG